MKMLKMLDIGYQQMLKCFWVAAEILGAERRKKNEKGYFIHSNFDFSP